MTSNWHARYPDLAGKVVVLAGESSVLVEVTGVLIANDALAAVVAADRSIVDDAVAAAESAGRTILGMTADPSRPETWERIAAHIEQRLGPIDVMVVVASEAATTVVVDALVPDMAARGRGVVVEVGAPATQRQFPDGVRHRAIRGAATTPASDVAQVVLLCASDTISTPHLLVTLGQPPR